MIPIRLKSTDVGAPVLNTAAGSLIVLFDDFLVGKLGWVKEFTGVNKAAYRQPIGTNQYYLQVDDSIGANARVRGFKAMTDVDTGTDSFPVAASVANFYWTKGSWGYDLIGVDKCFYFVVNATGLANSEHMHFFGDFNRSNATDVNNTAIAGKLVTSTSSTVNPFNTISDDTYAAGLPDGSSLGYKCSFRPVNSSLSISNDQPYPDIFSGGHSLSDVIVHSLVSGKSGQQGILPGIVFSGNSLASESTPAGDTFLDGNGDTILITRSRGTGSLTTASAWRGIYLDKDWG